MYPGGVSEFELDGKILIEFTHFNSLEALSIHYGNTSRLAMKEIQEKGFLPENYELFAHFMKTDIMYEIPEELIDSILNPVHLISNLV